MNAIQETAITNISAYKLALLLGQIGRIKKPLTINISFFTGKKKVLNIYPLITFNDDATIITIPIHELEIAMFCNKPSFDCEKIKQAGFN